MSTTLSTLTDAPPDHTNRSATTTTDADIVQNLTPGDVITATHLTTRQHRKYLENDDTTLMDVYCEKQTYIVLDTPNEDGTDIFSAKIIALNDYTPDNPKAATSAYSQAGKQTWNVTAPRVPYRNEGTGVVISRLAQNEELVTHVLRDLEITDHKEL